MRMKENKRKIPYDDIPQVHIPNLDKEIIKK